MPKEVLVVDNASSDGSVEMIKREFPHVHVIGTGGNLGFSKAANIGIKMSAGEYICLVNPDVIVGNGCIDTLVSHMNSRPRTAIAGPRLLYPNGRVQRTCASSPTLREYLLHAIGLGMLVHAQVDMRIVAHMAVSTEVDALYGSFWIVRRKAIESVGQLDEQFFLYFEDLDWCQRFRAAGWKVEYVPTAEAVHVGGACSNSVSTRCFLYGCASQMFFFEKYHTCCYTASVAIATLLYYVFRSAYWGVHFILRRSERKRLGPALKNGLSGSRWFLRYLLTQNKSVHAFWPWKLPEAGS
jgi:GT2 family glycosyltransferase